MSGFFWIGCILLVWSVRPGQPQPTDAYNLIGNDKASLGYNNTFAVEQNYRQSFCDQYEMVLNNSLLTESALEGKEVHVLLAGYDNYIQTTTKSSVWTTTILVYFPGFWMKWRDEEISPGDKVLVL